MSNKAQADTSTLSKLVENFNQNIPQYKSSSYDEANVRVDFIDKFFKALGWDVSNEKVYSEDYREVVREDKVIIQGKPKAPDYSFRIGGVRKFFVEAKKPSVDIKHATSPAFQIRRYAYTAKLPLSILTDFEEFAVYDTRIKPDQRDDASVGRIFYCRFTDYEKEWDYLNGSFDEYVSESKNKKGTSEVDKEFLKTIDGWRVELAKTIAKNNKDLETYDINYAVQKIIDRIIFLRFAEDQNIEEYGSLKKFLETKEKVYPKLDAFFRKADTKYNSSLFKPEGYISKLEIEDKALHSIIRGLYYPKCPYEFSVLPIEILGSIYEKFLGKTIRLTASHQAKVEEKPEVRKAGGVYYTPQYIVDYIVENTVGEKLKGKSPADFAAPRQDKKTGGTVKQLNGIQSLNILDPACGSGSFLVRAYDYLLKWYLKEYTKKQSLNKNIRDGKIYGVTNQSAANYRLSILTKQEILKRHIYGVDIDRQAVEVTKLSLLLKLMEGESDQTAAGFIRFDQAQLLPDLSQNIKCGNSLIGSDFYKNKNLSLFGTEEKMKINVFDWDGPEGFEEIMKSGGFDVVIGNPPWGADLNKYSDYLNKNYLCKTRDSAAYFTEIFINYSTDRVGLIIPKTISYYSSWNSIRDIIKKKSAIKKILDCGICFSEVNLEAVVLLLKKAQKTQNAIIETTEPIKKYLPLKTIRTSGFYPVDLLDVGNIIPTIGLSAVQERLIKKLYNNSTKIGELMCEIFRGLYIPDKEKEKLTEGKINFINKVPDIKYYYLSKIWKISLDSKKYLEKAKKILRPRIFFKVLRGKRVICYPDLDGKFLTTEKLVNFVLDQKTASLTLLFYLWCYELTAFVLLYTKTTFF